MPFEVVERPAVVQVRRVDCVPGGPQVFREAEDALRPALRVVEEQDLGDGERNHVGSARNREARRTESRTVCSVDRAVECRA